jgi:uroporphyrinogen-III decarboxylase
MDAVPCWFSCCTNGPDSIGGSPLSLASQISRLERYLRAAEGTDVGIIACFTSFYDTAMRGSGVLADPHRWPELQNRAEQMMDTMLEQQARLVRVVSDRFASDLVAVVIKDDIAQADGPLFPPDLFEHLFADRMRRLIKPAAEHGQILILHSGGKINRQLSLLHDLGFGGVAGIDPEVNDVLAIKQQWDGKLALLGDIPPTLLAKGTKSEIETQVRERCTRLGPGGGYVVGSSDTVSDDVPPENLMTMVWSVHKYGRFDRPGNAA